LAPVSAERERPGVARTPGLEERVLHHVAGNSGVCFQKVPNTFR
jgi:hypothetical protein